MKRLVKIAIIATCLSPIVFTLTLPPELALQVRPHGTMYCDSVWGDALFLGQFHVSYLGSRILDFINTIALVVPPLLWVAVGSKFVVRLRQSNVRLSS